MKKCTKCGRTKGRYEFYKKAASKDGLAPWCKDCFRSYDIKNKEARNTYHQKYYKENKGSILHYCKQYRAENKGHKSAYNKNYYINNRSDFAARDAKRRAIGLQATPKWVEVEEIKDVYAEAKHCQMHVDHIVPLQHPLVCGLHCWENLQLLTAEENRKKHNSFEV